MVKAKLDDYLQKNSEDLGVRASSINIDALPDHKQPEQVRDEIPTLNQFGYMKFELEEFSKAFINHAGKAKNPVLEIGSAYGFVTHKVLAETNAQMVANDINQAHLEVLLKNAPKDKLSNLSVVQGSFPEEIEFLNNTFDTILISRVLHFLEPEKVEQGLDKIHKWLTKDGKFICTNSSIYHSSVKNQMLETFEERIENGDEWAGITRSREDQDTIHKNLLPSFLNLFHITQLETLLPKHGFQIEQINYFDYPSDPWPDEGKGHIGFVASKI
jgi:polyketide synthase PksJ